MKGSVMVLLLLGCFLLAASSPAEGQIANVRCFRTTATQAIISYDAPGTAPCSIAISESPSYSPLVHDVDPALFPGSDLDSREGNVNSGQSRVFVAGRHGMSFRSGVNPFLASDGNVYSRALQAFTVHYFRISCGSSSSSGTFQTSNIVVGKTFSEPVPTGGPGLYNIPTFSASDRNQVIIDPNTGALVRRISLPGDSGTGLSAEWYSGGFHDWCSTVLSNGGYHCLVPSTGGNQSTLYWINATTGEVRFLGTTGYGGLSGDDGYSPLFVYGDVTLWDWSNANVMYAVGRGRYVDPTYGYTHAVVLKYTYTGGDAATSPGTPAASTIINLTPHSTTGSLNELMGRYSPAFNLQRQAFTNLLGISTQGPYLLLQARRLQQDSYAWFFAYDLRTGSVIAAVPEWTRTRTRWCGNHSAAPSGNHAILHWEVQGLNGGSTGPFGTTLTSVAASGDGQIRIAGEPTCSSANGCYGVAGGSDANNGQTHNHLMDAAVGDWLMVDNEVMEITGKSSGAWNVARGRSYTTAAAHSSGAAVTMFCNAPRNVDGGWGEPFWAFTLDPTGTDTTNATWVVDTAMSGAHYVTRPGIRVMSGWFVVPGTMPESFGDPVSYQVTKSPTFAGVTATAEGNSFQSHLSLHNYDGGATGYALDHLPFIGGNLHSANPGVMQVTGSLYPYIPAGAYPLAPMQLPTFGTSFQKPLVDVSGPNALLTGDPSDAYKYCIARVAGECSAGSRAGDVYVNVPSLALLYCSAGEAGPGRADVCIGNFPAYGQAVTQVGLAPANVVSQGAYPVYGAGRSRVITNALSAYRSLSVYANAKALPSGTWAGFISAPGTDASNNYGRQILLVKLPPLPASPGLDFSAFVPVAITVPDISVTSPSVQSAVVEFGYAENGPVGSLWCTQRGESCVKGSQAGDVFGYAGDPITGVSCARGCTITIPTVPERVPYYRIRYRDAQNREVAMSSIRIATDSRPPAAPGPVILK